jgi:PAS domain S-box-containing protein
LQQPEDYGIGRLFWITTDAIVGADTQSGLIVLWNPAAEVLFGYPAQDALGMPLVDLVVPELREAHLVGLDRYRSGGPPTLMGQSPVEVPALTRDGTRRDVALTLADVSQDASRRHVVAIIRDMTDLRQAQQDLERLNQSMQEFVATASHDLRAPLAAARGFSQALALADESLSNEQRQEFASAILRSVTRASRLVDDLLTLSQIQAGAIASGEDLVDVAETADEAARLAGADVTTSIEPGLVIRIDRHHLERMLTNLVANAARHGRPPIEVSAHAVGDRIEIHVTDTGDGVPDDFLPRLFDRFARASPNPGGTGLGLSIVRGLANAHGGDVTYDRSADGGARFVIHLPSGVSPS